MKLVVLKDDNTENKPSNISFAAYSPSQRLKLGVADGDKVCGYAVFSQSDFECYLEDIYVLPEKRRQGYGRFLITEFMRIASEIGMGDIVTSYSDENKELSDFLTTLGFFVSRGAEEYRFNLAKATMQEKVRSLLKKNTKGKALSIKEMSPSQKNSLMLFLQSKYVVVSGVCGDGFSEELSSAVFNSDGEVVYCMLCSVSDKCISIDMIVGENGSEGAFVLLFLKFLHAVSNINRVDADVQFMSINPKITKLTSLLLGDEMVFTGYSNMAVRAI